ncbi:MAG: hypothetical protein WBE80_13180 [Methylocella sp.]
MRAIIRFSIDGEKDGALSGKLRRYLEKRKFKKLPGRTAIYEHRKTTERKLRFTMRTFWLTIEQHKGTGRIDHFWMYADHS